MVTSLIENFGIHFSKLRALYLVFLTINAKSKGIMSNGKHYTFLLYWLCKYLIYTNFVAMVSKCSYYVLVITSDRPLALAPLFFSLLYKSLFTIIDQLKSNKDVKIVRGPLWFLPFCIY